MSQENAQKKTLNSNESLAYRLVQLNFGRVNILLNMTNFNLKTSRAPTAQISML